MFGFGKRDDAERVDQKVYDDAALDQLFGKLPFLNGVLGDISADETARVREKIAEKRKWADQLTDPQWRKAFGKWLDHAEYCCDKADTYREERPARRAGWEKSEAERGDVRLAARNLIANNPPS